VRHSTLFIVERLQRGSHRTRPKLLVVTEAISHRDPGKRMESLTRRSLLRTSTLALTAGFLYENSASGIYSERPAHQHLTVLEAPSNLGLKPPASGKEPGVRYMAQVLREHGLVTRLHAEDAGTVIPPKYGSTIDPSTKIRNASAIREYSIQLADRLGLLLDQRRFPLVLGGDCSILLGSALALRRRGRHGLLFIDGHSDLLTPERSQTGGAAGMDLALATGAGPEILTDIESSTPYIQPSDVVAFGYRLPAPGEKSPDTPHPPMTALPLDKIRTEGIDLATASAVTHLQGCGLGFWTHVDLDVLSPDWMPAVDSPDPGGMTPTELIKVLKRVIGSRKCVGMELTIYDPERDPAGRCAKLIVDILSDAFNPERTQGSIGKGNG
jgi:arginase